MIRLLCVLCVRVASDASKSDNVGGVKNSVMWRENAFAGARGRARERLLLSPDGAHFSTRHLHFCSLDLWSRKRNILLIHPAHHKRDRWMCTRDKTYR